MHISHPRCPYCHDDVKGGQPKLACLECMAWHHTDCLVDHGVCGACRAPAPALGDLPVACSKPDCGLPKAIEFGSRKQPLCLEHATRLNKQQRILVRVYLCLAVPVILFGLTQTGAVVYAWLIPGFAVAAFAAVGGLLARQLRLELEGFEAAKESRSPQEGEQEPPPKAPPHDRLKA